MTCWKTVKSYENGKYKLQLKRGGFVNHYRVLRYGEEWQDFSHSKYHTLAYDDLLNNSNKEQ